MMVLERTRFAHRALLALLRVGLLASLVAVLALPAAADLVINEVLYDPMGLDDGEERIELYNSGATAVDLSGHSLYVFPARWDLPPVTVMPGAYVVIRWNTAGADGPAEFFTGSLTRTLLDSDSIGYYITSVADADYENPASISDYVRWGAATQPGVAEDAGIWSAGAFIPPISEGASAALSPDGNDQDGPQGWVEAAPSFGGDNAVAVEQATWGRIKDLFAP